MTTANQTTTQTLANRINSFDFFYEMSDDYSKVFTGQTEEQALRDELDEMTAKEINNLRGEITANMDHVNRYFGKYFEAAQEEVQEEIAEQVTDDEPETGNAHTEPSFRSQVFTAAWEMLNNGTFAQFADALKAAWRRFRLLRTLKQGIAYFSFRKADDSIREAIGTLLNQNFEYTYRTNGRTTAPQVVKYWDVVKRGWRACRIDRVIAVSV